MDKPDASIEANTIPPAFDYDKLQDETTMKAIGEIWKYLGESHELLTFKHDTTGETIMENNNVVAQKIMNIIMENKVPDVDMPKLTDLMLSTIQGLFTIIARQRNEFQKELLARVIGTRNPGDNKYSREYASLDELFQALIRVRKEQGDNAEDYYTITKKAE